MTTTIKDLHLSRGWDKNSPLTGKVTFQSPSGETTLQLDEASVQRLVKSLAAELIESSRRTAEAMTHEIIDSMYPQLEAPNEAIKIDDEIPF